MTMLAPNTLKLCTEPPGNEYFSQINDLPLVEQRQLNVSSELVLQAAGVCAECINQSDCREDAIRWSYGQRMRNWYAPVVVNVLGGLLLQKTPDGKQLSEVPSLPDDRSVFDHESAELTAPEGSEMRETEIELTKNEIIERERPPSVITIVSSKKGSQSTPQTNGHLTGNRENGTKKQKKPNRGSEAAISASLDDDVRLYLTRIGRYPLLTAEEEITLAKQIEAGRDARNELAELENNPGDENLSRIVSLRRTIRIGDSAYKTFTEANLRLVVSQAKRYRQQGMEFLDLIQEGNLGLMHAVDLYDWRRGFKFSTYAMAWIRQAIKRGIDDKAAAIRRPVHRADDHWAVTKATKRIQEVGEEVTDEKLAYETTMNVAKIRELKKDPYVAKSLSDTVGSDSDTELGDRIEDRNVAPVDESIMTQSMIELLKRYLDKLSTSRNRDILKYRYGIVDGERKSLDEIGTIYNLSRERIRQIESVAISELRGIIRRHGLEFSDFV